MLDLAALAATGNQFHIVSINFTCKSLCTTVENCSNLCVHTLAHRQRFLNLSWWTDNKLRYTWWPNLIFVEFGWDAWECISWPTLWPENDVENHQNVSVVYHYFTCSTKLLNFACTETYSFSFFSIYCNNWPLYLHDVYDQVPLTPALLSVCAPTCTLTGTLTRSNNMY